MEKTYADKAESIIAYGLLALLLLSLLPVVYLGRYNHPTGDDFYYGADTHLVWEETGNLASVLAEAARGVALQYQTWQGTYSAMFLMYLPPNVFSMGAYRLVTFLILSSLTGGIFYLLRTVVCDFLQGSRRLWIAASSAIALLWVQTVPSQGETFFWYNGSMYYTGFFALTLFYFGVALRYIKRGQAWRIVLMIFLSVFLAGGNYVSLLPALLLMGALTLLLLRRKGSGGRGLVIGLNTLLLLAFLGVSAAAPGNAVRQSMLDKVSPVKAIALSLLQGLRYLGAWAGIWWLIAALLLFPLFWHSYRNVKICFRYPLVAAAFIYGIFCSMSCPTFYTMHSTGPARAVAIVYYGFILATFSCLYYVLGSLHGWLQTRGVLGDGSCEESGDRAEGGPKGFRVPGDRADRVMAAGAAAGAILLVVLQLLSGAFGNCTTVKAVKLLASGQAAAYEREFQERLKVLEDESIRDVEFAPYENQPDMLYVGDFSAETDEPTNQITARFFGKDTIRVKWYD